MAEHEWNEHPTIEPVPDSLQKSDSQMMAELQRGEDCMGELLTRYRSAIVQFMYRLVQVPEVAEELSQEVFIKVYRCRMTYRVGEDFTVWVYRIATHIATQHLRYNKQVSPLIGCGPDPSRMQESAMAVQRAIASLPAVQRVGLVLHKYQRLTLDQIAGILKLNGPEVQSLLFDAYRALTVTLQLDARAQ